MYNNNSDLTFNNLKYAKTINMRKINIYLDNLS